MASDADFKADFAAVASAAASQAAALAASWLPGGKRQGTEYLVRSVWRDEKTPSLSVSVSGKNLGKWGDFGGTERGNDLISLYAALRGLEPWEACKALAQQLGVTLRSAPRGRPLSSPAPAATPPPTSPPPEPAAAGRKSADDEGWRTMVPVPPTAPAATFRHQYRKPEDIVHTAEYRMGGQLLGYVVRFRTSEGGKETLPYTWCTSARDGASRWHWRQWDVPRPLYVPLGSMPAGRTVVLVEGEKKAGMLQELLEAGAPGVYLVVSWPGGCKAWRKALWDWLKDCTVLLWPDCDGKRAPLSREEREQYPDELARAAVQAAKPLLPAPKQVGMAAMLAIGSMLREWKACTVQLLPIPEPGEVSDGWDCADAIATDGWDFARVQAFFARAGALPPDAGSEPPARGSGAGASGGGGSAGGGGPPGEKIEGPADAEDEEDEFAALLKFMCTSSGLKVHELGVTRKLIITALRKAPALRDCLGLSEMTDAPCTRVKWPWRREAGPLLETDDLALGDYLSNRYKLKAASRAALTEAIDTVADSARFHPIQAWLKSLKHDGQPRSETWLIHVLGLHPDNLRPKLLRYLELVGRLTLLGLVARVMDPGCKFDYSMVLEGITGMRKSTLIKALVGKEYFSDTHFDLANGGRAGFEQFKGLWAFEMSELTPLRRADSDQVKQFFSSEVDRFRGAYGKYVAANRRQVVIFCSTNKTHYLYDTTGNRRFWPVPVKRPINIEWLAKWRDQLFAEALALYLGGAQIYPSLEEEKLYFVPQQNKRMGQSAVQSKLYELLTRIGAPASENKHSAYVSANTTFITLSELVVALGTDAAKSNTMLETQVSSWMQANGWKYKRETTGQRRYGFKQPKTWPPPVVADDEEDDDDETEGGVPPPPPSSGSPPAQAGPNGDGDDAPF